MFQENISPVNDNNNIQQHPNPSLPPPRFQRRSQRLRRQDDSATASESSPPSSDPAIVSIPPVTLSVSVGVSAPPPSSSEAPSTTQSPTSSSSYIYSTPDTWSASSSDSSSSSSSSSLSSSLSSSSLPSSSESPSTSSSQDSPTFTPSSTTTQPPPHTPPNDRISLPMSSQTSSPPPMSSPTSISSGPTITDTPPPPPPPSSSSSSPTPTMSSSVDSPPPPPPSSSVNSPPPPPPSSSVNSPPPPPPSSSSNSGLRDDQGTSNTPTPPPSTSVSPPPTSTSVSISVSSPDGVNDVSTTTPTTTPTPPPPSSSGSSSSTPPGNVDVGGGSSSSSPAIGPSSPNQPGDSTSSRRPPTTTDRSGNPVPNVPMQSDGSPTNDSPAPMTTLSEPVTFTTTDASGSTILTVPPQFTTVIVTTLPGGTFTTVTEVVANPPGVLNQGDANRDSVAAFFQNKGAVAGVFIAISLAICAIVLFVIFALRRRRYRVQNERDAEIAAGLAAAASNQRFADDEDHPVVMRNVPSAMRGRSPWLDDDDDVYHTSAGPVMYNNYTGVGPPTHNMPITSEIAYPLTAARYTHARSNSGSPSPKKEFANLPPTTSFPFEPVSPTGNSGWSSHGGGVGGAYLGGRDSVSPAPTNSAPASANHGTATHAATSAGHAPSSYGGHRPPASVGREGSGPGTGSGSGSRSGGTSQPSLMTATAAQHRASSPKLEDMYPPEYEQFSRRNSSAAVMGYAYEPDPVPHEHQIVTDLREVRGAYDGIRSPPSGDVAMSVGSRSMYSHEGEGTDDEGDIRPREDSRLDPVMRMTGGLASAASVGPRDHEDYTRRVVPQQLTSPSTGSHSYSLGHSHSTH